MSGAKQTATRARRCSSPATLRTEDPRRRRVATRRGAKMESIVSTSLKLAAWGEAKVGEDRNNRPEPRGRPQSGSRPLPARQPTFDDRCTGTIGGHADNVGGSSDPGILGSLLRFLP